MSDNVHEGFSQKNHRQENYDQDLNNDNDNDNNNDDDCNQLNQPEDSITESNGINNNNKRKNLQTQSNNNKRKQTLTQKNHNLNNNELINQPKNDDNNDNSIEIKNEVENDDNDDVDDVNNNDDDDDENVPHRKRFKKHLINPESNSNNNNTNSNRNNTKIDNKTNINNKKDKNINNNNKDNVDHGQELGDTQFSDKMEARFLVSSRDAGAIIGRGGSNITHLRQTYESSVTVPDCLSPERVLTIVASVDKITKIVKEILKFLDTNIPSSSTTGSSNYSRGTSGRYSNSRGRKISETSRSGRNNVPIETMAEMRILLHTSHAGGLIGKGGSRITQLREETKAGIKVYSECCPQSTERVCAITGSIDIVTNAIALILNLLRTFPIKGPNQYYNPGNFDPFMSMRYGGFGETSSSPPLPHQSHESNRNIFTPPPIPPPPPAQYHHPAPPLHHHHHPHPFPSPSRMQTLNGPPPSSAMLDARTPPEYASPSSYMSHWPPPNNSGRMAAVAVSAPAYARAPPTAVAATHSGADIYPSGDDPYRWMTADANPNRLDLMKRDDVSLIINPNGTAIATIKVNNKIVGAIIGRGGTRIKDIRIKTQADISIDAGKNTGGGSGAIATRCITVKGLYNDVQTAVSMICQW